MRAIVLTAVVAGFVGMSAGVWLKSTVLANAAEISARPAAAISVDELMRNVSPNLPATVVADYM